MRDIAKQLGLSPATVSLALAGRPVVAEATRIRIQKKAAEMGYRKNPLVAALMRSRRSHCPNAYSPVLAYLNLYPERDGHKTSLLPDYFPAAAREAKRMGFRLERFWVRDPAISQQRLCDMLYARGIGGVLVGACPTDGFELSLDWSRFCWTSLTLAPRMPAVDYVGSDHFSIMSETLRHVIDRGGQRIGLMMRHSGTCAVAHAWMGAYFAEMHDAFPGQKLMDPFEEDQWTVPAIRRWLRRVKPQAVVGVIDAPRWAILREAATVIPQKLKVCSVVVKDQTPELTGMREDIESVAVLAVRHLVFLAQGNETGVPPVPRSIRIPGVWNPGVTG